MRQLLLVSGSLLPLVSSVVYIASILKGKSRPHRMTRLLMVVIGVLFYGSLLAGHDTSGVWLALVSLVQAVIIWLLSLKWGMGGKDRLDFICLGLCVAGLGLWLVSGQSLFGLGMSILADLVACVPSLRKTICWPHTESAAFFLLDTGAGLLIVLAGPFTWRAVLFPAYIVLINALYVAVICWPRAHDKS